MRQKKRPRGPRPRRTQVGKKSVLPDAYKANGDIGFNHYTLKEEVSPVHGTKQSKISERSASAGV